MDSLVAEPVISENESLDKDFVSDVHSNEVVSQFSDLYKSLARNRESSQAERRDLFLQEIKKKRNELFDEKRDFTNIEEDEEMEVDKVTLSKRKRKYANRLMFTEWLCDVPSDLEENWFVKFCPYGKRCLVVAEKYKTTSYNRRGEQLSAKFESLLPGGNRTGQRNKFTLLECLYSYELKCYFVLDVLFWNSMPMRQQNVEFRFFWLRSKFAETPELSIESERNKYQFHLLDYTQAVPFVISEILSTVPRLNDKTFLYDGILFYHKESIYISGFTPLVTWLKPYMLPEVYGVHVNAVYMEKKPQSYENFEEFIKKLSSQKGNVCEVDMMAVEIT